MHRRLFALAIFVCCAALGASAATHTVTVSPDGGINYSPAELTIAAGDTVNWVWSPNAGSHSVVQADSVGSCTRAGSAFFASSVMSAGGTFSATFNDPGTFGYFCSVGGHCGAGMKGQITVNAAAASSSAAPSSTSAAATSTTAAPATSTTAGASTSTSRPGSAGRAEAGMGALAAVAIAVAMF